MDVWIAIIWLHTTWIIAVISHLYDASSLYPVEVSLLSQCELHGIGMQIDSLDMIIIYF